MKTKNLLGRDSKNRLTDYSLSCGYMENQTIKDINVRLWKEAGCAVYQVTAFGIGGRILWENFSNRCQAYAFYKRQLKLILKAV